MFILKHLKLFLKSDQLQFVWTVSINYWQKSMMLPRINKKFPKKKKKRPSFQNSVFKEEQSWELLVDIDGD